MLFFAKLVLAPSLVAVASLIEGRFGHRLGGWTAGFPIVAGPILFFLAWEQGHAFAAQAAHLTLLGVVSLAAYCVAYAWMSRRHGPGVALPGAYAVFAAVTLAMAQVTVPLAVALAIAAASLVIGRWLLPAGAAGRSSPVPRPSLPVRMAAAALIVVALTGLAHLLGPRWSGLLVPFPVAGTVIVVAAHRAAGSTGALAVIRGFLPALFGFSSFCAVVAALLPRFGLGVAFGAGVAASALCQAIALRTR